MPTVNHVFPGAGLTPWSVWRLTLRWWLVYARAAKEHSDEMNKQAREAKQRGK